MSTRVDFKLTRVDLKLTRVAYKSTLNECEVYQSHVGI